MRRLAVATGLVLLLSGVMAEAEETAFEAGVTAYGKGDYLTAREQWERAVAAGDWDGARNLGTLYRKGQGVEADPAKAADYFRQAADHGIVSAEINLAELYLAGQGVPKDIDRAKVLLGHAADQGNLAAKSRLDGIIEAQSQGRAISALTAPAVRDSKAPAPAARAKAPALATRVTAPAAEKPAAVVAAVPVPIVKPLAPPPRPVAPVAVIPPPPPPQSPAPQPPLAEAPADPSEPRPMRVQVASYKDEADAARGWLVFNLPGLEPELDSVTTSGKVRMVRLYAVGPAEIIKQLCDDAKTRGAWCAPGK